MTHGGVRMLCFTCLPVCWQLLIEKRDIQAFRDAFQLGCSPALCSQSIFQENQSKAWQMLQHSIDFLPSFSIFWRKETPISPAGIMNSARRSRTQDLWILKTDAHEYDMIRLAHVKTHHVIPLLLASSLLIRLQIWPRRQCYKRNNFLARCVNLLDPFSNKKHHIICCVLEKKSPASW